MTIPTLNEAFRLIDEADKAFYQILKPPAVPLRIHSLTVAGCAFAIASYCSDLDAEKAFVLGLLHDYGRIICDESRFHGLTGYQLLKEKGYEQAAQICLTHTFLIQNFSASDYASYNQQDIAETISLLQKLNYTDYDRLIQLSDMLTTGTGLTNPKARMKYIVAKYNIPFSVIKKQFKDTYRLKQYFDKKTGHDIYKLLGIW